MKVVRRLDNAGLLGFLVRRLLFGAIVVLAVAVFAYAMPRVLRADLYPGEALIGGVAGDLRRTLLELDPGEACSFFGCPKIRTIFARDMWADLYLLAGSLAIGVSAGVAGGVWCATRPRTRRSRAVEGLAALLYCTPVYVMGLGLLLLFEPNFGLVHAPLFFHPGDYVSWHENPWLWFRAMLVPWLVLAAPVAAICLRVTVATSIDVLDENYIRTARGKGLPERLVVRRHAAPQAHVANASLLGAWAPFVITNMVLVEYVFFVPGFFLHTKRALGQLPNGPRSYDLPLLQALALWAAVLIVVLSMLADVALWRLDPRLRASGRPPG